MLPLIVYVIICFVLLLGVDLYLLFKSKRPKKKNRVQNYSHYFLYDLILDNNVIQEYEIKLLQKQKVSARTTIEKDLKTRKRLFLKNSQKSIEPERVSKYLIKIEQVKEIYET